MESKQIIEQEMGTELFSQLYEMIELEMESGTNEMEI